MVGIARPWRRQEIEIGMSDKAPVRLAVGSGEQLRQGWLFQIVAGAMDHGVAARAVVGNSSPLRCGHLPVAGARNSARGASSQGMLHLLGCGW